MFSQPSLFDYCLLILLLSSNITKIKLFIILKLFNIFFINVFTALSIPQLSSNITKIKLFKILY